MYHVIPMVSMVPILLKFVWLMRTLYKIVVPRQYQVAVEVVSLEE